MERGKKNSESERYKSVAKGFVCCLFFRFVSDNVLRVCVSQCQLLEKYGSTPANVLYYISPYRRQPVDSVCCGAIDSAVRMSFQQAFNMLYEFMYCLE